MHKLKLIPCSLSHSRKIPICKKSVHIRSPYFTKISWNFALKPLENLKSTTFLLVNFVCLKESTCEKRFLFNFKSSLRSRENQILEFFIFKFRDIIKCLSIKQEYISLNNLGSKYSQLMRFGQFMSYYKKLIKKFYKNCYLKTSSRPFCVCKEVKATFTGK